MEVTQEKLPLISVIIPVYNVEKFLHECIDSVINQTYKNIEIILIDDGSTDNSGVICDEYKQVDGRVIVVHQSNGGLSNARNNGISIAKGEYITFLDSDDHIEVNMIKTLFDVIADSGSDISSCDVAYDKETLGFGNGKISCYSTKQSLKRLFNDTRIAVSACMKLYKSYIVKQVLFEVGRINEDYLFAVKVLLSTNKICFIEKKLYYYRTNPNSITHKKFSNKNLDLLHASDEVETIIKNYDSKLLRYVKIKHCYIAVTLFIACVIAKKQNEFGCMLCKEVKKYYWLFFLSKYSLKNKLRASIISFFPNIAGKIITCICNRRKYSVL